jgi:stage V sporulation protein SpoVS
VVGVASTRERQQTSVSASERMRLAGKIAYDCREKGEAPTVLTIGAHSINVALKVCPAAVSFLRLILSS